MSTNNGATTEAPAMGEEQLEAIADRVIAKLEGRAFGRPRFALSLLSAGTAVAGMGSTIDELYAAARDINVPIHRIDGRPLIDEDDLKAISERIAVNRRLSRRR